MNELNLLIRFEEVVKLIFLGVKIVDIGLDYVYLLCFVYLNGYISGVVVGEIIEGFF